jgi:Omp85 superfamily domain
MKNTVVTMFIGVTLLCAQFARAEETPATREAVPGSRYQAGWLHRVILGAHWRDLWADTIEVPVLDCRDFAGGLVAIKRGGGLQTSSLRFKGGDGKEYKFRSLDKDPSKALPPDLQESIAADILQDQISSSNPFAAMVAAPLLNAAGVMNAEPILVILPDDPALGEFRGEFAGMLGTLEENPIGERDGEGGFEDAGKVIGTYDLFGRLEGHPGDRVDARAYLTARLMDIYLGDWDRHRDQWRWAGYRTETGWLWKPIPRDRDQAFSRLDGLVPWLGSLYIPQLEGFSEDMPDVESLTWSGRFIDRRLLAALDKPAWDSIAAFLVDHLTDTAITAAVHHLPEKRWKNEGAWLAQALKGRRSWLRAAADEYYAQMSKFPDIRGTNHADVAEITAPDVHSLRVKISRREKGTGEATADVLFDRTFSDRNTDEVRIYLLGGDDRALLTGTSRIHLIIIGGAGEDEIVDHSNLTARVYDSGTKTTLIASTGRSFTRKRFEESPFDSVRYEPPVRDYGHEWMFVPRIGLNPDEGLILGGQEVLRDFSFGSAPYNYRMQLSGGIATSHTKVWGDFLGEFCNLVPGARIQFMLHASQIDRMNFFGSGNETSMATDRNRDGYYKAFQEHYAVGMGTQFSPVKYGTVRFGSALTLVRNTSHTNTLVRARQPYGSEGDFLYGSFHAEAALDSRDNAVVPHGGFFGTVTGSFSPQSFDNRHPFGHIRGDARTYLTPPFLKECTVAIRAGGEKVWGEHPFFESAFLGGTGTLRGFERERFAGDASLYGSTEIRISLGRLSLLVPERYGLTAFCEAGRVFSDGEQSDLWHPAFGGGLWVSFLNDSFVMNLSVAHSVEMTGVYLTGGFTL